jgi:hypothetical protein
VTPELLLRLTVRPTLAWLAGPIAGIPHTPAAERLLLAIAIQETSLLHRRQVPVPHAMGWWQFERGGGVAGVLAHPATQRTARAVCAALRVDPLASTVHPALEHNDLLACCFARLLLRSDPRALPDDQAGGWQCYMRNWRPGKPHPHRWDDAWRGAETALAAPA